MFWDFFLKKFSRVSRAYAARGAKAPIPIARSRVWNRSSRMRLWRDVQKSRQNRVSPTIGASDDSLARDFARGGAYRALWREPGWPWFRATGHAAAYKPQPAWPARSPKARSRVSLRRAPRAAHARHAMLLGASPVLPRPRTWLGVPSPIARFWSASRRSRYAVLARNGISVGRPHVARRARITSGPRAPIARS